MLKFYHRGTVCKDLSCLGNVRSPDLPRAVSFRTTVFTSRRAILPGVRLFPSSGLSLAQTSLVPRRREMSGGVKNCGLRKCSSPLLAFLAHTACFPGNSSPNRLVGFLVSDLSSGITSFMLNHWLQQFLDRALYLFFTIKTSSKKNRRETYRHYNVVNIAWKRCCVK